MEWYASASLLMGSFILLLAIGFPVAFAFLITNLMGMFVFSRGFSVLENIVADSTNLITTFVLVPVPMFILMGALFFHTGLAVRVFDAIDKLLGRIPGRLCYLTVIGGALFSTLTGSSMANTAMLGSLMVPEMERRGYSRGMSMGPIMGTGGLAMIIPPSALAVLLASIAEVDVGRLLIAGIIPGFLLAALYAAMIFVRLKFNPALAPPYEVPPSTWREKLVAVCVNILPMGFVVFMVVGVIILGIATPSEAAVFGAFGVLILAVVYRRLTWKNFSTSLMETVRTSGMVFFILMNSTVFSQLLAMSGATSGLLHFATGYHLPPLAVLAILYGVLTLLGMFMDPVSMILITVPVFYPLAKSLGFDPIWFSLIVLISLEMGNLTPPFGLLLYVMMGMVPGVGLLEVSAAAFPYVLGDIAMVVLVAIFPSLALFLPNLMS
jgi:tripartite ATP-independent transporter DctM subunit